MAKDKRKEYAGGFACSGVKASLRGSVSVVIIWRSFGKNVIASIGGIVLVVGFVSIFLIVIIFVDVVVVIVLFQMTISIFVFP